MVGAEGRLEELLDEVQVLRGEADLHTRMVMLRKTIQANRVKLLGHFLEQRELIWRRPLHEVAGVVLRISEDESLYGSWYVRIANAAADVVEDVLYVFQAGGANRLDVAEEAAFHDLHELGIHLDELLDDLVVSHLPLATRKSIIGHDWLYRGEIPAELYDPSIGIHLFGLQRMLVHAVCAEDLQLDRQGSKVNSAR